MQVVWEADTAAFASRKRAARACAKCRAAKKRCHHTFQRDPDQQADTDGLERVLPNLTHKEPIRFVGDLNPESILTDLSSRPDGAKRISRIGTWVEQSRHARDGLPAEDLGPVTKAGEKTPINVEKYGKVEGGRRVLTGHQRNYLQAVGAFRVLPKATQDALVSTYIACIDGILPIIDGIKLLKDYTDGKCSIFLLQAICLVTCKTEEAASYLRLYDDGPLLDPIPFARSLHTGLDAAMKADLEPDRVTKIQILTLMHLHNDGPGGIEESSLHLSQAIHDAWTAGLHIHTPGRTVKDSSSMLWWTIWTLDKINACVGGRPIMIANRDIDIERPNVEAEPKSVVIAAWLRLGDLLDKVIEFYRPTADPNSTGWETEFPTYQSIVEGIELDLLPRADNNILEISYNVIAILSCRTGGPTTASYARRIGASDRIQQLISNGGHTGMAPIPLIPYAVGLSLTVAYRGLRDNYLDAERAQADLATRCETLEKLSTYWWTADALARLGRKALKSLQQPGVQKHAIGSIANALEAETSPCKFGPFEQKIKQVVPQATVKSRQVNGNALHVLSHAAATHSNPTGATPRPSPLSSSVSTLSTRPEMPTPPAVRMVLASSSNKPFPTDGGPLDMSVYDNFNNLDNLFDGFFDLSMPTIFQDPLFDGDTFINANVDFGIGGMMNENADSMGFGPHSSNAGGFYNGVYPDMGLGGREH
ncbi:hypothetical protein PV10_07827 [Exophiala mesophila]|uniref:Xylanolytic transcriptional activator regulatory domain-containing protein n=1 Tax=Exophiala mesophila TaxID=212818 RepID=A0A0D1Z943_EXOME|nr:uncharacterized protein PV10_07827 [Exophiala mesophila]KIV90534.1 hypothetical protein PV10_07827 [Exophiala mesophila]